MEQRIDYMKTSQETFQAVLALELYISQASGLEHRLLHLLKIRASHINGCAYCLDLHMKEARKDGLGEQWIALISAWRESPVYDARERALLGWTDALTALGEDGVPDTAFEAMREHFTEDEIAKLTVAVGTINLWNRVAIAFRTQHPLDAAA